MGPAISWRGPFLTVLTAVSDRLERHDELGPDHPGVVGTRSRPRNESRTRRVDVEEASGDEVTEVPVDGEVLVRLVRDLAVNFRPHVPAPAVRLVSGPRRDNVEQAGHLFVEGVLGLELQLEHFFS